MIKVLVGFAIIVLCSLNAKDDDKKDPPPPEDDSLAGYCAPGCSPTFCANCSWSCNNQICVAACNHCLGH